MKVKVRVLTYKQENIAVAVCVPRFEKGWRVRTLPSPTAVPDNYEELINSMASEAFLSSEAECERRTIDYEIESHSDWTFDFLTDLYYKEFCERQNHPSPREAKKASEPVAEINRLTQALEEIKIILTRKSEDYSTNSWDDAFVEAARQTNSTSLDVAETMLAVKQARLIALRSDGREPANESIRDSLVDRAGYAILALALHDQETKGKFTEYTKSDI